MEELTPIQRVATITIGLVLTVVLAIVLLPWAGEKITDMMPPTKTPVPPTATPLPTSTPTRTPVPTPTPTLAVTPAANAVLLEPVDYTAERPDYCSLAPLGIMMSYWGYTQTHDVIEPELCPGNVDAFVTADEMSAYAVDLGLSVYNGVNGDLETVQVLLANGFPVIITRWTTATTSLVGRHQLVRGYDTAAELLTVHDYVTGPDFDLPQEAMVDDWRAFNRAYFVLYPAAKKAHFELILDKELDPDAMWENALAQAESEIDEDETDALALLNKGSALVALAQYEEAKEVFDQALEAELPLRLLRYRFEILTCLLELEDYEGLIAFTQTMIDDGAQVEEVHLYRAQAYVSLADAENARIEYERALAIHPDWAPAEQGLTALGQ